VECLIRNPAWVVSEAIRDRNSLAFFTRCGRRWVGLKILCRNPRRPGEAGMKLVADQSRRAAEKEILEGLASL
jgi:hypothetical protein